MDGKHSDALKFQDYTRHGDIDQYIANHVGPAWMEYRQQWKKGVALQETYDYPLYLTIETHFKCNYRCIMCFHSDNKQRQQLDHRQKLGLRNVKRIIDEAAAMGTPSICMNGGNEPLMDRDIHHKIAYARKKGIIDVFITTNGSLLTAEMTNKLIDAGLTQIRISLDAWTPETYRKVRIGHDLHKVEANILRLLDIRSKEHSFFPIVRISFVEMNINLHEFEDFRDYWQDLADYVSIQRYTPVNRTPDKLALIPDRANYKNSVCSMPFTMCYIRGNGDIYPCGRIEYGPLVGNVHQDSIYRVWNSPKMQDFRGAMLSLQYEPGCRECLEGASLI